MKQSDKKKGSFISRYIENYLNTHEQISPLYTSMEDSLMRMKKIEAHLDKTNA